MPEERILRAALQQRGQIAVILGKRQGQPILLGFPQGGVQQADGLGLLVQHGVGRRCLDADVQRNQPVVEGTALFQQLFAAANDLGPFALRQQNLIFHHVHHRATGGQKVHRVQIVPGKGFGDALRSAQHGVKVSAAAVPHVQPDDVVLPL